MNTTTCRCTARDIGLAIALSLAASLLASPVNAQVFVTDQAAIAANHADATASYVKQGLQYAKQAQQYATQVEQLSQEVAMAQNILMKAQSLGHNIQLFDGQPLQPITDSESVIQSACPGADAGVIGDLLSSLASALSPNEPIAKRQQMICAQIVIFQIDEYNKTADALNQIGTVNMSTLAKLNDLIASVDTLGTSSNATAQAANITATMQAALGTWRTEIQADEDIIQTLKQQQSVLATVAMKGSNTVLGTLVQAAALQTAFEVNQ
ncbi:hypothetical protein EKH79_01685 [Dyella dinghuensis]|uniref:P-type conjugative transfer protein TrbJ n=1 Tax=Dyella dinghuensis TaxID=1920169 RepID=A0A432LYL4_9GAMM|nr:hypothetical protein [Dyella dinghuensis]RUL66563.1 hypothetical protein EKH79_01685 [Dyella dinghuensis]